jgi:hypothetical protein
MKEAQTHAGLPGSGSHTMFPTDNPTMMLPTYRAGLGRGQHWISIRLRDPDASPLDLISLSRSSKLLRGYLSPSGFEKAAGAVSGRSHR